MKTRPGYVIELGFRLGTSPPLICGVAIRWRRLQCGGPADSRI